MIHINIIILSIVFIIISCLLSCYCIHLKNNLSISQRNLNQEIAKNNYITRKKKIVDEKINEYNDAINLIKKDFDKQYWQCYYNIKKKEVDQIYDSLIAEKENSIYEAENKLQELQDSYFNQENIYQNKIEEAKSTYNLVLNQAKALARSQDEYKYMCLQLSDCDKSDIDYLYSMSQKLNHPDTIYKLIWSEYIQKPFNELLRVNGIDEVSGIYKITNVKDKRAYVGKSTNIKKRLQDHMKSAVGISTIADQKVHHAMREEGLWNFTFEILCVCDKEELSSKEKEYIEILKTKDWGYNQNSGG